MKTSVVIPVLALAGCAALSDRREELLTDTQIAGLHRGASRAEVRELLGAPSSAETLPRQREVWTYQTDRDGVWREDVLVQFSPDGIVREILLVNQAALRGGF